MPSEKRRHTRAASPGKIAVSYTDTFGTLRHTQGNLIDISKSGCKVVLEHRLSVRSLVKLENRASLLGMATVRYQDQTPQGFITGLEFVGGLRGPAAPPPAN